MSTECHVVFIPRACRMIVVIFQYDYHRILKQTWCYWSFRTHIILDAQLSASSLIQADEINGRPSNFLRAPFAFISFQFRLMCEAIQPSQPNSFHRIAKRRFSDKQVHCKNAARGAGSNSLCTSRPVRATTCSNYSIRRDYRSLSFHPHSTSIKWNTYRRSKNGKTICELSDMRAKYTE